MDSEYLKLMSDGSVMSYELTDIDGYFKVNSDEVVRTGATQISSLIFQNYAVTGSGLVTYYQHSEVLAQLQSSEPDFGKRVWLSQDFRDST